MTNLAIKNIFWRRPPNKNNIFLLIVATVYELKRKKNN